MCSHIRHTIPPTCHKLWQAKVVHVFDLLISDASLHLFCRDQSKVTHNCLWETRPAAPQWCCSLMKELLFFCPPLRSVRQCWTTATRHSPPYEIEIFFFHHYHKSIFYCCANSNHINILYLYDLVMAKNNSLTKTYRSPFTIELMQKQYSFFLVSAKKGRKRRRHGQP